MIELGKIREAVEDLTGYWQVEDGVRVSTQCLYPTNANVVVTVRGSGNTFVVSDDGGAIKEAASVGLETRIYKSAFAALLKDQGLKFDNGAVVSPAVPVDGAGAAIVLVANASKRISEWCFDKFRYRRPRPFKELVAELLDREFGGRLEREVSIAGYSNSMHKFDYALPLRGKTALVDTVVRDHVSINSRVVANIDVSRLGNPDYEQFVIFDDADEWTSPDLALLKMAATLVPFSTTDQFIGRWKRPL